MDRAVGSLTVFFEDPFWVGVFERVDQGKLSACKVTFGAEPRDCEVLEFILKNYDKLRVSPAVEAPVKETARNPKRAQREARRQVGESGVGTRSQQALKLQQEQQKTQRKQQSRERQAAERERLFALKQQKRKEKHRGR